MQPANDNLEKVYTLEEAAEAMRMTTRTVAKAGKKHGLCMAHGRQIMFTVTQLVKLQEALTWVSNSSSVVKHTTSGGRFAAKQSSELRELAIARSRKPSALKLKKTS